MQISVRFSGDVAEKHRMPAYEGLQSLTGISRSILICTNYLAEGRVRRRDFEYDRTRLDIVHTKTGSIDFIFEYLPVTLGAIAGGIAGNLAYDLLKTTFNRVIGTKDESSEVVQKLEERRPGDIEALAEAIEPAIRLGHNVINYGVLNVNISAPQSSEKIASFDSKTKISVWTNAINNSYRSKLFSIGSYNANSGIGRAFDLEEGRSITFEIDKDADIRTTSTIINSISNYAMSKKSGDRLRSAIAILYTSVDSPDGRLKKIRILKARSELADL